MLHIAQRLFVLKSQKVWQVFFFSKHNKDFLSCWEFLTLLEGYLPKAAVARKLIFVNPVSGFNEKWSLFYL